MEQERQAREREEKEKAERQQKIKEQFVDPNVQWEKDKNDIQKEAMKSKEKETEQQQGVVAKESVENVQEAPKV